MRSGRAGADHSRGLTPLSSRACRIDVVRSIKVAIAFATLVAAAAGGAWFLWLASGNAACSAPHSGFGYWAVAAGGVVGAVVLVDRFRAWQTRSRYGSVGLDLVTLWLALICIVAANLLRFGCFG